MSKTLVSWIENHYGLEIYKPGLERAREALSPILSEIQKIKIVTIAGTNGKGETTLRLSSMLKDVPHCTWTSPHITRINERFISERGEISDEELEELVKYCHQLVIINHYKLTYYEFLFMVFCYWAYRKKKQVLLLEVGLGGRLDAVNVLDADLVLLSSISRDHAEILGHRYELILKEKLGVLRPNKHLMSFLDLKYLRQKAQHLIEERGAYFLELSEHLSVPSWNFRERNDLLAFAAYQYLKGVDWKQIPSVLTQRPSLVADDFLSNRGEVVKADNTWTLYGSHNTDGVRKLIQFLSSGPYNFSHPKFDLILTSFSQRDEKDIKTMLKTLKLMGPEKVKVCSFTHTKAFNKDLLKKLVIHEGLEFVEDMHAFFRNKKDLQILVVGSYYFLGELKSILGGK